MNPPRTLAGALDGAAVRAAVSPDVRRDVRQRDIVDDAIALMGVTGTLSALEFLKHHAVDPRVITRVLLDPGKRRGRPGLAAA